MKYISICIPTYEMRGSGAEFLRFSFKKLTTQVYKDFDIIISDHSENNVIKEVCESFSGTLDIHYYRNSEKRGNSSANLNFAIQHAAGKLIKVLFQDDFIFDDHSLSTIVDNFDLNNDSWLVTGCEHSFDGITFYRPFYPKYNDLIHLGKNTISSPSVLTIKNDHPLLFDEQLIWLMDCDYYKRCYDAFGLPKIVNTITVVNRTGEHQVSNTLANKALQKREYMYILKKFNVSLSPWDKIKQAVKQRILQ